MRTLERTKDTIQNILTDLLKRSPNNYTEFEGRVNDIIENVRANGDDAVFDYTKRFDGADITAETIQVTEEEIAEAYAQVDDELLAIVRKAKENIRVYHEKQKQYSWFDSTTNGTILGQKVTPIARAGVYVPGGKAVYPSSVLMNIMPAKVAGVEEIIMTTPCDKNGKVNPTTLVAAKEAVAQVVVVLNKSMRVHRVICMEPVGAEHNHLGVTLRRQIIPPQQVTPVRGDGAVLHRLGVDPIGVLLAPGVRHSVIVLVLHLHQAGHGALGAIPTAHHLLIQIDRFCRNQARCGGA